jgi:hypothetical protein
MLRFRFSIIDHCSDPDCHGNDVNEARNNIQDQEAIAKHCSRSDGETLSKKR